ncbi:hypothetical protein PENTCL1PPCAC_23668, partial [Pristionchus entomophagus]
ANSDVPLSTPTILSFVSLVVNRMEDRASHARCDKTSTEEKRNRQSRGTSVASTDSRASRATMKSKRGSSTTDGKRKANRSEDDLQVRKGGQSRGASVVSTDSRASRATKKASHISPTRRIS